MRCVMIAKRFGQFQPREVRAEAIVHATPEGEHGWWIFSSDIEAVRVVVDARVPVGRRGVGQHEGSGGDADPGQFDVLGGSPDGAEYDWVVTHHLVDRVGCQFGMLGK